MNKSNTNNNIFKIGGKFINSRFDIINHKGDLISIINFAFYPMSINMITMKSHTEIIVNIFSIHFKFGFGVNL